MNIKFGMDNFYVRYLKRFLNKEMSHSSAILGSFDKLDQQLLIEYLNLPNVKDMFEVQKEILEKFPEITSYFNFKLKDDLIYFSSKQISKEVSEWLMDNSSDIREYCQSCGWELVDISEWLDSTKDINNDGIIDDKDRSILYSIIYEHTQYDDSIMKKADLNLDRLCY